MAKHNPPGGDDRSPADRIRAAARAPLPRRFWREAGVAETPEGFLVTLDGRAARTPGRRPLAAPTRAAAEAMAAEWAAVGEEIDPTQMPVTRLVNAALDGVAARAEAVRADVVRYAGSDLLCYRAGEPQRLAARQRELWDPPLAWAKEALGARLRLAEGVMFVEQPAESLAAVARAVAAVPAPRALAALHALTSLTGSAILALALAHGAIGAEAAWRAAHLDEDTQIEAWGEDAEAMANRARRRREFDAAVLLVRS